MITRSGKRLPSGLNEAQPTGRALTLLATAVGVAVVAFTLFWFGRNGALKVLVANADRAYLSGQYGPAADGYGRVLALDPSHLHARVNRARTRQRLNRPSEATSDFEACAAHPATGVGERLLVAECLLALSRHAQALDALNAVLAARPADAKALTMRARAHESLALLPEAVDDVTRLAELDPTSGEVWLWRSRLRERANDAAGAAEDMGRVLALGSNADHFARRARLHEQLGRSAEAAADYRRALDVDTDSGQDQRVMPLVRSLRAAGDVPGAEAVLGEALGRRPGDAALLLARANLRHDSGDSAGALDDVNALLTQAAPATAARTSDAALLLRARIHRAAGEFALARKDLDVLLARKPEDAGLLAMRAGVHRRTGDTAAMRRDWAQVIAHDPDNAQAYVEMGVSEWQAGHASTATEYLNRAVQLGSQDPRAFAARGRAWMAQQSWAAAVQDLSQALILRPDEPGTLLARARAYEASGEPEEAQADFDRAVQLEAEQPRALIARGRFFAGQGQPRLAVQDLQAAAGLLPDAPESSVLRVTLLMEQARTLRAADLLADALAASEQALALAPGDQAILKFQAGLLEALGQPDRAQAVLAQLQQTAQGGDVAYGLRAAALLEEAGRTEEALAAYREVLSQTQQAGALTQAHTRIGKIEYDLNRHVQSLASYQAVLDLNKADSAPEVFLRIGLNRRQLGRPCSAVRSFRVYLALEPLAPQRDELLAWMRKHPAC